ncbi:MULTISPECIES: nucleoside-diphosphate kinase [Candidatus Ichthyocystis]|uniref:Nucleoside diphosphate kinase n=1 Tax=Candidatus Ichthyocystis hellenicum TaxID=1561003 RepID=A0A0S4M4H8_9BURK|nr:MULTISPECIES: nucleoside-diphosphate kinase [Ichthyocystis]CUT17762.1 Nucleoside diphosphate kinase [Candidatus Ichthyocystis hellenicum]
MSVELTLSIIKPDAVRKNLIGAIYQRFESAGLVIVAAKMLRISSQQAEEFYSIHRDRPFFGDLVSFMSSGPVMVQVLKGEFAVLKNREIMGATDPKQALPGTIRSDFADSIDENAVHGSDSTDTALVEIAYFFSQSEICEHC